PATGAVIVQVEIHDPHRDWATGRLDILCEEFDYPASLSFAFLSEQSYLGDSIGQINTFMRSLADAT
ncbi:MAG: hypothetical protein MI757_19085, partial [Pirellulales bacterium]|nr:hypothetical protein [Pirellulales bacterium]